MIPNVSTELSTAMDAYRPILDYWIVPIHFIEWLAKDSDATGGVNLAIERLAAKVVLILLIGFDPDKSLAGDRIFNRIEANDFAIGIEVALESWQPVD